MEKPVKQDFRNHNFDDSSNLQPTRARAVGKSEVVSSILAGSRSSSGKDYSAAARPLPALRFRHAVAKSVDMMSPKIR
jgi:hypothetical protein